MHSILAFINVNVIRELVAGLWNNIRRIELAFYHYCASIVCTIVILCSYTNDFADKELYFSAGVKI